MKMNTLITLGLGLGMMLVSGEVYAVTCSGDSSNKRMTGSYCVVGTYANGEPYAACHSHARCAFRSDKKTPLAPSGVQNVSTCEYRTTKGLNNNKRLSPDGGKSYYFSRICKEGDYVAPADASGSRF